MLRFADKKERENAEVKQLVLSERTILNIEWGLYEKT